MPRYQATLIITPSFVDATKELQKLTLTVQRMNIQATQIQQQVAKVIQFPAMKAQHAQLPSNMRRMSRFIQKLDRMLQSVVDRIIHELGSISRQIMRGFEIASLVSPISGALGFFTFNIVPTALAAASGVFRWLWNKVTDLGNAMLQDRLLAMQAGTTVGAIRAFRVAFPMLDDPDSLIATLSATRLDTTARMSSVIHWFLGVKRTTDTISVIIDTLISARDFMRSQPEHIAMLMAQRFGLTKGIPPKVLMMLREMSDEELMRSVRIFQGLRPKVTQKTQAQNMLVDFILSVKSMWMKIEATLGNKIAEVGLTDSLIKLSKAAAELFKWALDLPVTQRMLKGLEEELKWFGDWLSDTKTQKTVGKVVTNMILNFERGVAILVEASGDLEEAQRIRHEAYRFEARQARRDRGLPARPRRIAGFPIAPAKIIDFPSQTGKRTEPMTPTTRAPTPTRPSSTGTRPTPPSTPSTRTPTPSPTTPPSSTAPAPRPGPVTPPTPPINLPPVRPPTAAPAPVPGPTTPPVPPINAPPVRPPVTPPATTPRTRWPQKRPWTRHPNPSSAPSNQPLPPYRPRQFPAQVDDDVIPRPRQTPWTRNPSIWTRHPQPGGDIAVRPPVPTAGVPGLPGGPSGPDPRPTSGRPRDAPFTGDPFDPVGVKSLIEAQRAPLMPSGRPRGDPFAGYGGFDPITGMPRTTAGIPGMEGTPSGPSGTRAPVTPVTRGPLPPVYEQPPEYGGAPYATRGYQRPAGPGNIWHRTPQLGGDIAVRPPVPTAGVPGARGGPSGAAAYGPPRPSQAPQFPSITDDDIIQRRFRTGQRTPINPRRYAEKPFGGEIAVRPPVPAAGYPGYPGTPSGPRPERPAPTAPSATPSTTSAPTGVIPGATMTPSGSGSGGSLSLADKNWNRYLDRMAFLETDYDPKKHSTGGNQGYFQQMPKDVETAVKNKWMSRENAQKALTGTYAEQKAAWKEYIQNRYGSDVTKAIESGDWKTADDSDMGNFWGSLPGQHQRASNVQKAPKLANANKILEDKGPLAPDKQPGSSSYPSGKVPGAVAPDIPSTTLHGTSRGTFNTPDHMPTGLVVHYTGGVIKDADAYSKAVSSGSGYMSKYNAQLFMDQEGNITRITPYGTKTWHAGVANDWAEGMEISTTAGGENPNLQGSGINAKQLEALKKYYIEARKAGMYKYGAWGHSEVNPPPHRVNEGEYEARILRELDQQNPMKYNNVPVSVARDPDLKNMLDPNITQVPDPPSSSGNPRGWSNPFIKIEKDPVTGRETTRPIGTLTDVKPAAPLPQMISGGKFQKGKWVGGKVTETPKNVPAWLSQPNLTRDFKKDSAGQTISPNVLKEAEKYAARGDKKGVQDFIKAQGIPVSNEYCADFVTAVVKARGGDPEKDITGPLTDPKDKGPYETASNWLDAGDHVDPKDVQPGDIAVAKKKTYGKDAGAILKKGDKGGHIGLVGSEGYNPKTGKFQFFAANKELEQNRNANDYEFRRMKYPQPNPPPAWGDRDPIPYNPEDYLDAHPGAHPMNNLRVDDSDLDNKRVVWDKKPGSDVRKVPETDKPIDKEKPKTESSDTSTSKPKEETKNDDSAKPAPTAEDHDKDLDS